MMVKQESQSRVEIPDKYYLHQILFYSFGILANINKDFFTTANDYWMYKFRDPDLDFDGGKNRTILQAQFISSYSIATLIFHIGALLLTVAFLLGTSLVKRLLASMITIFLCMIVTVFLAIADTDSWQIKFFGFSLLIGAILAVACCVFTVTVFQFPPKYLTFIITGMAISGIFSALTQIFALAIGADSRKIGITYFSIGTIFTLLIMLGFTFALYKSPLIKQYLYNQKNDDIKPKFDKNIAKSLFKKVKLYLIGLIILMGSTQLVHPAVTSLVISENKGNGDAWSDIYFVPVITFLFYNVCDLIARETARIIQKPKSDIFMVMTAIIRVTIVPLIMFCNAHPRHHLEVVFGDWTYIVLMMIFGLSHGYLINLAVLYIPIITTDEEMKLASVLLIFVMTFCVVPFSLISPYVVSSL